MIRRLFMLIFVFLTGTAALFGDAPPEPIVVTGVQIRIIEQVEVPSRVPGLLDRVDVREGQVVSQGDVLGALDDTESRLVVDRARLDLEIARRQAESELKLRLGRKTVEEANQAVERAEAEQEIARRKSEHDAYVRYAKKAAETAAAELERANQLRQSVKGAISDSELDNLRLLAVKASTEVETTLHDLAIAELNLRARQSERQNLVLAAQRRELETQIAEEDRQLAELARLVKQSDLALAEHDLDRRTIRAPVSGVVVQIHRRRGEWLEPGEKVLRLLRLDRLRVEGFISSRELRHNLELAEASVAVVPPGGASATYSGRVVFVSPEIDPVNDQVRIWVEVDNPKFELKPGMKGTLTIRPGAKKAVE
jgi:multidrug efflux pump subunit AcrA (membrane-fusion protein)